MNAPGGASVGGWHPPLLPTPEDVANQYRMEREIPGHAVPYILGEEASLRGRRLAWWYGRYWDIISTGGLP